MIIKQRTEELLPNRRSAPINFYDVGQYLDGDTFKDIPFTFNGGHEITLTDSFGNDYQYWEADDFTIDRWQDLYDEIIAIEPAVSNWRDVFRKLTYEDSYKYGVSVYQGRGSILSDPNTPNPANQLRGGTNPEWTAKGLKSKESWLSVAPTGGLAIPFDTSDTTNFKITAAFDYSAADSTIDFKKGGDVFLIPQVLYSYSQQNPEDLGHTGDVNEIKIWAGWAVKSRELYLDKTLQRSGFSIPPVATPEFPIFEGWSSQSTLKSTNSYMVPGYTYRAINDVFADQIYTKQKAQDGAICWASTRSPLLVGGLDRHFEDVSNFPVIGGPNPDTDFYSVFTYASQLFVPAQGPMYAPFAPGDTGLRYEGAGVLCAVVITPGGTRYIWRKTDSVNNYWPLIGPATLDTPS
jgi:hypothetical protein